MRSMTDETMLRALARRLEIAARLEADPGTAGDDLLDGLAAIATAAMDAQAASIAIHDAETGRLVFVAAAGPAAGDVVGLSIAADAGIAGYAFSTGQPLAVSEASADPRFDRTVAAATGYLPGTLLATPLADDEGTVGVLEVLDRRGGPFTLADLDLASTIASAVTVAVRRRSLPSDASALLRASLAGLGHLAGDDDPADAAVMEALVAAATDGLVRDDDPTWRLVDRLAGLHRVDPASVELATDWVDALLRRRGPGR